MFCNLQEIATVSELISSNNVQQIPAVSFVWKLCSVSSSLKVIRDAAAKMLDSSDVRFCRSFLGKIDTCNACAFLGGLVIAGKSANRPCHDAA